MSMPRIGMLVPSSNTCIEDVTPAMVTRLPSVSIHYGRLGVRNVGGTERDNEQFDKSLMYEASRLLTDARVDIVVWNGTSGSWLGIDEERQVAEQLSTKLGVPFITSTMAFMEAFKATGVRDYGLAVPYLQEVTLRIISEYRNQGYECAAQTHLGLVDNLDIGAIPESTVADLYADVATGNAQAVIGVCTNMKGARVARKVEVRSGLLVLDSVSVTLWLALRTLGVDMSELSDWGHIFAVG